MSLLDDLNAAAEPVRRERPSHPAGFEPGIAWDGKQGTITSRPLAEPGPDWRNLLLAWGFDPEQVEVVEPVQVRTWDAAIGDGNVRTMWYYKAGIRARRAAAEDIDDLLALVKRRRPQSPPSGVRNPPTERSYWLLYNDLQLGKQGTTPTVERIVRAVDQSVEHLKREKRAGRGFASIYLPGLGDILEACGQHYPAQAFEVEHHSRDQRKLARRLIYYAIDSHASLAERLVVPVVGGNHGENNRHGGKSTTSTADNGDIEVYEQVAERLTENPAAYGHVSFVIPYEELSITVQPVADGPIVGLTHGHLATAGQTVGQRMWNWWLGQMKGQRPVGDADVLVAAHWHQFLMHRDGRRLLIVSPTIDNGSPYYAQSRGAASVPGMLSFVVDRHGVNDWHIF